MNTSNKPQNKSEPYREIDILDYVGVLAGKRWLFVRNFVITCVLAALVSFLLPKKYSSTATILPPVEEQRYDFQSLLPEIAVPALGISAPASPSALFVEILGSRAIGENVLRRLYTFEGEQRSLLDIFNTQSIELGLRRLKFCTTLLSTEQGIVIVKVELLDPKLAADVANAYVQELDSVNQEKSISRAKNSRIYIEEQLGLTESKLQSASQALTEFQQAHKAISIEEQTKAAIVSAGELKGQILAKQIEMGTLGLNLKADNPQIILVKRELDEMQARYDELQYGNGVSLQNQKEIYIPIAKLPEVGRQLAELIREAKVQETVWQLLNQQYYQAKIQEARDTPTVQQLDIAVPPEYRSHPKRKFIVMVGGMLSLVLTLFWVFAGEYYRQVQSQNSKFDRVIQYFKDDIDKGKKIWRKISRR